MKRNILSLAAMAAVVGCASLPVDYSHTGRKAKTVNKPRKTVKKYGSGATKKYANKNTKHYHAINPTGSNTDNALGLYTQARA